MTEVLRSALGHELTLHRAHRAARDGDLDLAARLLDELDAAGASTTASLDLRARVHAQQGNLADADRQWARVLLLNPGDRGARSGRETIAQILAGRRARPLIDAPRAAVAAGLAVTALVAGLAWTASDTGRPLPERVAAPASASVDPTPDRVRRLEERIASLQADRQAQADQRARDLNAIAAAFDMPGVRVQQRAEDVRLLFEEGVFRADTEVSRKARPLLTEVGRRLAAVRVATTVVGHTVVVAGGRTSGGSTVAFARAQVAAQHLSAGGGLPLTAFTLATADQSEGPFPDAVRNRTVTLLLRPAG